MFSQNEEEKYITEYFGDRVAKFIDIGAFDVFQFSNTRRLYELGWGGILVEPAPKQFQAISDHYKDEPRIEVLNVAIGLSNDPLKMYICEDAVSTSVGEWKDTWQDAGVPYVETVVNQMYVGDFMDQYCTSDVKFISLDTEKTNMEIFRHIPDWVFKQIDLFCIEHDGFQIEIYSRLQPFGFRVIYTNAENVILAK